MLSQLREKLSTPATTFETFLLCALLIFIAMTSMVATDMYVPSLPYITQYFSASTTAVKLTISAYFLTFSVSQLIYGPLSDGFGRRIILIIGLVIFLIGSALCVFAWSINALLVGRLLQGIG